MLVNSSMIRLSTNNWDIWRALGVREIRAVQVVRAIRAIGETKDALILTFSESFLTSTTFSEAVEIQKDSIPEDDHPRTIGS
jgi:hypothetical protein